MLKDIWVDLEDKVQGDPDSGSEISVKPINNIAHSVIENEEKVDAHETSIDELNKYDQELFNRIDEANTEIININIAIGNIDSALDELHNYAQGLIGGDA